jgi:hypothetical protein
MYADLLSNDKKISIHTEGNSVVHILSDTNDNIYKEISITTKDNSRVYVNSIFQNGTINAGDKSAISGLHINNILSLSSSAEADLDIGGQIKIQDNRNDHQTNMDINRHILGNIMNSINDSRDIIDSNGSIIRLKFSNNINIPNNNTDRRRRIRDNIVNNNNNLEQDISIQYGNDRLYSNLPRNTVPSNILFETLFSNNSSSNGWNDLQRMQDYYDNIIIEDDRPYVPSKGVEPKLSKFDLINQQEEDKMMKKYNILKEKKEKNIKLTKKEKKELKKMDFMGLCVTCCERPKKVISNGCGHLSLCIKCANKMIEIKDLKCPMCRVSCTFIPLQT